MSLPAICVHLPRYPDEPECSWSEQGKCQDCKCRYSLLADRPRIREWSREEFLELIDAMPSTCALELASQGALRLEEIAAYLGIPRTLVEQFEALALKKLARSRDMRRAHWDDR
jgi:hypothetical protein